ncbi:acetylornithine aminotransferase [Mycobacterium tuberculosis]|nr:acetylornithine aminotransferase [Mycobacterium tuberculosis]
MAITSIGSRSRAASVTVAINAAAPDVIRLAPPLIIAEAQLDGFVAALPAILDRAVGAP